MGIFGDSQYFNLLLFNFLNDIGLGRNLMQPPELIFVIITIAFDVWAVYILKQLKKRQKQFALYSGLISIFLAIMYTAASYRIIYEILGIKSKFIAYIMAAFFIALCILNLYLLWIKLTRGHAKINSAKRTAGISLSITAVGLGMVCHKFYRLYADIRSQLVIIAFVLLFFGYCFIFTIHNIYKYYLITKH